MGSGALTAVAWVGADWAAAAERGWAVAWETVVAQAAVEGTAWEVATHVATAAREPLAAVVEGAGWLEATAAQQ